MRWWIASTLILFVLPGCRAATPPATQCSFNSDCLRPLVCAAGFCRVACLKDVDCEPEFVCEQKNGMRACEPRVRCIYNSECAAGEICANDGNCRPECEDTIDCLRAGNRSTCSEAGVCVDPDAM